MYFLYDFLNNTSVFLKNTTGLDAPLFSWIAAFILLIWPLISLLRISIKSMKINRDISGATNQLQELEKTYSMRPGQGLSLNLYDQLNSLFKNYPFLAAAWVHFRSKLVRHTTADGVDTFFSYQSSVLSFNEESIIDTQFNRRYYNAIPGIVTGLGLLATFAAILIALFYVSIDEKGKILGIGQLINGLSGKFVSSVAALFSAMIYLAVESHIFHRSKHKSRVLAHAIDNLVPQLTSAQIVADIKKDLGEQTNAFRLFNTDLSGKLKNSMSESIGPILERMASSVDNLNELIRAAEAKKDSTISDHISSLLHNLKESLNSSLEKISSSFSDSLTGTAKTQFDKMANSLGNTAHFLEKMNEQFVSHQSSISELIAHAKETTSDQMTMGRNQMQELSEVMKQSIEQLRETALGISTQMARTIEESASQSRSATGDVISKVSDLNSRSAERLEILLERHKGELDRIKDIDETLSIVLDDFRNSIKSYGEVTTGLKQVTADVNGFVSTLARISKDIKDGQIAMQTMGSYVTSQIDNLKMSTQEQKETWKIILSSMSKYQETFARVEGHAKSLMEQIANNMSAYSSLTKEHMDNLIEITDNMIGDAVGKLSSSIDDLQIQLETLNDTVEKINRSATRVVR